VSHFPLRAAINPAEVAGVLPATWHRESNLFGGFPAIRVERQGGTAFPAGAQGRSTAEGVRRSVSDTCGAQRQFRAGER
jgi:hypothetical protein